MDGIEEWTQAQRRVVDVVTSVTAEQLHLQVPACPDWTVLQLLSHVIGLDADVIAGDEPDDHNSTWTQAQVDARADHSLDVLLSEWEALIEPMRGWTAANGTRPLGDILIHEQDLRGAVGVSGAQRTPGLLALRERFVGGFGEQVADRPAVALVAPDWQWASRGSMEAAEVVVEAGQFDLTRSLMSRRSQRQLQAWTTRGDITDYLPAFGVLGALPSQDLSE